jgi:hypothetical protein
MATVLSFLQFVLHMVSPAIKKIIISLNADSENTNKIKSITRPLVWNSRGDVQPDGADKHTFTHLGHDWSLTVKGNVTMVKSDLRRLLPPNT